MLRRLCTITFSPFVVCLVTSGSAFAGNAVTNVVAVPSQLQRASAIALVQPADYVCATVFISSHDKDTARQAEAVRTATQQITAIVAKSSHLQLHEGPLRFYTGGRNDGSTLGRLLNLSSSGSAPYGTAGLENSPLFSSSLRVLYRLDGVGHDPFTAAVALRRLIDDVKVPNTTHLQVVSVTLAVDSPERQRERLLALIRDSADAMKKTFGASEVTIGGLDGAVLVRQVDHDSVELFIDYQLSVTAGK